MADEHLEQMRSLAADWKAVAYSGSDDDYVVVATIDEAVSLWDRIENMQAAQITVGEVKALRAEIERLRALITAWIDAKDAMRQSPPSDITNDLATANAEDALRKAVGR